MINAEKSKRLDGQLYYNQDPLLLEEHLNVQMLLHQYNHLSPDKRKKRRKLLKQILDHPPKDACIEQPFHCDFGYNIRIGSHFYSNYNLTILDCNTVTIGHHCLIGPNVSIITVNHPQDRKLRSRSLEYAKPVSIGNDVWIGYEAVILAGVTIGDGAIIGTRAVVTKDVPPYTIVGGVPAKPIRKRFSEETIAILQDLRWWDWEEEKIARHIWDIQAGDVEKLKKA